jgi:hypothetical protein
MSGYVELYQLCNGVLDEISDRRSKLLSSMQYKDWLHAYEALQQCLDHNNLEQRLNRLRSIRDEADRIGISEETTRRIEYFVPINDFIDKLNGFIDTFRLYYSFIENHEL